MWDALQSISRFAKRLLSPDRHLATLLVLMIGLVVSIAAWKMMDRQLSFYHQVEFNWVAQNRNRIFQRGITSAVDAIQLSGNFVENAEMLDLARLRSFYHKLLFDHPWLSSLNWIPEKGSPVSVEGEVDLHNSAVQDSLQRARTLRRMTASFVLGRHGEMYSVKVYIVVPVLSNQRSGSQNSADGGALLGLVVGTIDISQLANLSISILEPRGVEFLLLDMTMPHEPQFLDFYASRLGSAHREEVTAHNWQDWRRRQSLYLAEYFQVADRVWAITCAATPQFRSAEGFSHAPSAALMVGLLLTGVTTFFFYWTRRSLIERTALYEELVKSETTLRVFFEQSPDTILIVDREGVVRAINRELPILGEHSPSQQQVMGKHFVSILPQELLDVCQSAISMVLQTGQPHQFSHQVGKFYWWEVRIAPIRRENRLIETMVLFTNVSERRTLELKALRNARLASMGTLAAGIAHEINNPNNAVTFNVSLLKRSWQDALLVLQEYHQTVREFTLAGVPFERAVEAIPRLLAGISNGAERISKIIESLKALARDDMSSMGHFVNVEEVIRASVTLLEHQVKRHSDHFTVRIDGSATADGLLLVWGNFQQLEQVIINLVMNALLSLPERSKGVLLQADCVENMVRIMVEDEGCGIDHNVQPFVFDPFFTTRADRGGTGLGLSLVQEIVSSHRGTIQLYSKPGEGSQFTILLPLDTTKEGRPQATVQLSSVHADGMGRNEHV
ncbi:ATP-binding protein [Candidatus Magnetaquicoccus inordinatus]|uniref:ATP-binding protein n=1 Tax=Candidatus Magnetaquicoccus inordinatus TaxID=2496818 RepID=UPI00102CC0EA|nr:ATP-binding protein [Candidatus Magnetaquicoccus inordinatus]